MTFSGKAGIESPIPEKCVKIHPKCTKEVVVFRLTQFNTISILQLRQLLKVRMKQSDK